MYICRLILSDNRLIHLLYNPVSMSQVSVLDVEAALNSTPADSNSGWYTQIISGPAPEPRVDFCVVVVSAPDRSSFNIHMYGGE